MKFRALVLNICLLISTGCLGAAYLLAGYWLILPVLLGFFLFVTIMNKRPVTWLAYSFLLVYVTLLVVGAILDLSTELLIIASTSVLACWDLIRFEQSMAGKLSPQTSLPLEKHHLSSLAVATITGLLLAFLSLYIQLQLPFIVTVLLALIASGGLTYSVRHTKHTMR